MVGQGSEETQGNGTVVATEARALAVGAAGIETARDFSNMMSALMSDLIEGKVAPNVANAVCNAGGKLLKMVELQQKYGKRKEDETQSMRLAG